MTKTIHALILSMVAVAGCATDVSGPEPEPSAAPPTEQVAEPDAEVSVARGPNLLEVAAGVRARLARADDALLPARVRCDDPIAGTWVSREHFDAMGDWYRFELHVARDGTALRGEILARTWTGTEHDLTPPACGAGFDWSVTMTGAGAIEGDAVRFGGRDVRVDAPRCGRLLTEAEYNPDRFSGHLLEDGEHLVAFNNDGGRSENDLHVFRRTSCR